MKLWLSITDDGRRAAQHLESDIRRVLALTVEADGRYGRYRPVVKDVSAHHLRVFPDQTIAFLGVVPILDEELDGLRYDILFTVRGNLVVTQFEFRFLSGPRGCGVRLASISAAHFKLSHYQISSIVDNGN